MAKRKGKRTSSKRKTKSRKRSASALGAGKLPKGALTLAVLLRPREGQELLLEAELRALVGPTRKEDGCLTYNLLRSADPPPGYLLHEVWVNREAHTQHTRTAHFLRWNARKDALLASRDARFWLQIA
jgi:quinol monooxygenase YgiN